MFRWLRTADWTLAIIVGTWALVMYLALAVAMPHRFGGMQAVPAPTYADAVRQSAIRTPDDAWPLRVLTGETVTLVRLTAAPLKTGAQKLEQDAWAAHPDDIGRACRGAANPRQRMQQVLGLADRDGPHQVWHIKVATNAVVRPCLSGDPVTAPTCGLKPAAALTARLPADADEAARSAHREAMAAALARMRVAATNVLGAWSTGFRDQWAKSGEYPFEGVPFTGMGWTWNWAPDASSPFGVTEFVIPAGTEVTVEGPQSPAEFCRRPG